MTLTAEESEHLLGLIDGLTVAHTATLDACERLRAEISLVRPIVALVELYLDSRNGLCEEGPASIRTMLGQRLLDYRQKFGTEK